VRGQLAAAALALGDEVELVVLSGEPTHDPTGLDALVTLGPPLLQIRNDSPATRAPDDAARRPLIVALAPSAATGEHVRMLEREADLVLPALTHGRVILATVLALLRWRGGR
jgi:hypothetical protein